MRKLAAFSLALLLAVGVASASQTSSPQSNSEKSDSKTAHGNSPQAAAIDCKPAANAPAKACNGTAAVIDPERQIADDTHELAKATDKLALATVVLVIISAFQIYFLIKADRTNARAANAATKAAGIAEKTSDSNLAIAQGQFEELRQARVLEHRPKLRVRNIVVNEPHFPNGKRVAGQFLVSNVGGVRAHVVDCRCDVIWGMRGLPMQPPYTGKAGNFFLEKPTIAAGAYVTGSFCSDGNFDGTGSAKTPSGERWTAASIYVLGWIEYDDDLAIRRRTVFCRQLEDRDGAARFYRVDDPDYEHED